MLAVYTIFIMMKAKPARFAGYVSMILSVLVFGLFTGCDKGKPADRFPKAAVNQLDDRLLSEAVDKAEQDRGILSLLVFRNSDLIVEAYFGKGGADSLHRVKSVTKSVTSILIGMAIDQGHIGHIDETVGDYLAEYLTPEDSVVAGVTIRELLTMTGGFDWNELTDPEWEYWNNWVRSDDHFIYALRVPIIHEPGTHFTYCTTGCQIMSGLFTEATGYSLKAFAEEYLFAPLGITGDRPWGADQHGFNYGGVTLRLTATDMLKIGRLYLNGGEYNDRQVVPEGWVTSSSSPQVSTGDVMLYSNQYGYYWWIGERQGTRYYFANGFGGQFIVVFPDLQLVVVAQSELNNDFHEPGQQWVNTLSIIMNDVLGSVL